MTEIRGERVLLRGFRADELDALYEGRLRSTTMIGEVDRERLRGRVEVSGSWHGGGLDLAVEVDGELVGAVDVRENRGIMPPGVCELGIELWAEARGSGLGTDAVAALTRWLHDTGFPRVQAGTDVGNAPMRRALEKAGFACEGTMRAFMRDGDGRADYALYAHVDAVPASRGERGR
jgi:RimJ/RimL family protein N-acetyltransferase